MKTILKWTGGKSSELPIIKDNMPKSFERYVEPFLGGGALFFDLEHKKSLVNDFNKELIDFYKIFHTNANYFTFIAGLEVLDQDRNIIRNSNFDDSDFNEIFQKYLNRELNSKKKLITKINMKSKLSKEEESSLYLTGYLAAHFYMVREQYNNQKGDKLWCMAWWLYMRELAYSGMFRFSKSGKFNVPYGGKSYNSKSFAPKITLMNTIRDMDFYKNTEFTCGDFQDFFQKYDYFGPNDFIFLDPPYDTEFSQYNVSEDFNTDSQIRLANQVSLLNGKFMLVVKETPLILNLYQEYNIKSFDKTYSVNFHNRNNQKTKHLIITNY